MQTLLCLKPSTGSPLLTGQNLDASAKPSVTWLVRGSHFFVLVPSLLFPCTLNPHLPQNVYSFCASVPFHRGAPCLLPYRATFHMSFCTCHCPSATQNSPWSIARRTAFLGTWCGAHSDGAGRKLRQVETRALREAGQVVSAIGSQGRRLLSA